MATTRLLRTPPPKKLDDYVVSVKKTFGEPGIVPDSAFLKGTYAITWDSSVTIGGLNPNEGYSVSNPIGFDITINGKTYKEFSVATSGWMMLRDPAGGTTGATFYNDVINESGAPYFGSSESISTGEFLLPDFLYDHIVLAPWIDQLTIVPSTVAELVAGLGYSGILTSDVEQSIIKGADSRAWPFDAIDHGVRYLNGYDSKKGKYLVVRWTVSQNYFNYRFKFEVVLYENGTIEYRYWPRERFEPGTLSLFAISAATAGIFWSGPSMGSNKFRDLAGLLDYDLKRSFSELGGSNYDSGYSETSYSYSLVSLPFTVNLTEDFWPRSGAIITMSPPTNPGKFLPRKISSFMFSTKNIVPKEGLFDDRKTINFYGENSSIIHMPSTLPSRLIGDTGNVNIPLRQLLFTSGSLKLTGSMKKSVIDSNLEVIEALEKITVPFDNSYNETTKNYQETAVTSSFYAQGSSLDVFGNGFTSPLKSKTKFHLSLPVTKNVTMPSLTSSFYYYDLKNSRWSLANPEGYRAPEAMVAATSIQELGITNATRGYFYRVTETARGFDAVGRKVVSGSNNIVFSDLQAGSYEKTFQTDDGIGSIFNSNPEESFAGLIEVNDAITKKYKNSITNNLLFYPEKTQTFSIPIQDPFLIEKVVVNLPLYISGAWFNDLTTCNRAFGDSGDATGVPSGSIDFAGPGLTFAVMCPRKIQNSCYVDLIASGTITHALDDSSSVILYKDYGMNYYSMRPVGFRSFSNPTTVISGTNNVFIGNVKLELESSVAGGLTFARNDRSLLSESPLIESNLQHATSLLTTKK